MPPRAEIHPLGITWTIEDEAMTRSWHALADGDRVWLVDPLEDGETVARAQELGRVAGVLQLLDRHNRAGAAIAEQLGVPLHRLPESVADSPFEAFRLTWSPIWKEVALWWPEPRALVVAEAVGRNATFAVGDDPVGVHIGLRLLPPRRLAAYDPEHLLMGHGGMLSGPGTADALHRAIDRSRRDAPRLLLQVPKMLRGGS